MQFQGHSLRGAAGGRIALEAAPAAQPWTEPRACVKFGPACPQQGKDLYGPVGETNEDCLYLNVWTPAAKDDVAKAAR